MLNVIYKGNEYRVTDDVARWDLVAHEGWRDAPRWPIMGEGKMAYTVYRGENFQVTADENVHKDLLSQGWQDTPYTPLKYPKAMYKGVAVMSVANEEEEKKAAGEGYKDQPEYPKLMEKDGKQLQVDDLAAHEAASKEGYKDVAPPKQKQEQHQSQPHAPAHH